jgi:hypothetical protein
MKNRMVRGLILTAMLIFGSALYAQTSNAVPYQETFEGLAVGSELIVSGNTNGWYSGTNTVSAFVTNVSYAWTNYPVESAAHTKVLKFSEANLTNRFATYAEANTTVDFLVQPVRSTAVPGSSLVTGSQAALYLDTNGLLNVWYGIDNTGANNAWQTYANTPVGTADWARITIEFDYTTDPSNRFFKVSLNGSALQPSTNGYLKGSGTFTADPNGTWLLSATQVKTISSFSAIGSGMLDDLVVAPVPDAGQSTTNGTPYAWLDQYGLTNYVADDVLDQNEDGLLTWQEYIAGTVPTNAASVLMAAQAVRNVITWNPLVTGRVYSVQWSTNLVQGFTNLADSIVHPQGSYTNTLPDAKVNHYRIKVRLP